VALSTLTLSCKKEIESFKTGDKEAINEITATFADLNKTKTVIGSDSTSVLWNPGDEIKIFYGASNVKFTSINTIPSISSIFTSEKSIMFIGGDGSNDYIWGVYPYSDSTQYNNNSINITVPSAQTAFEGSFAPGSFPSIGRSKTTAIPFYNICGGVMFSVTRDDINSVTFRGKNNEIIAGSANVSFNDDGVPQVSNFTAEAKQITVSAPDGGCFKPGVKYFIVAFPASLTQGWVLTYNKPTTCAKIESSSAVSIKRSVFAKVEGKDAGVPFGPKEGNIEFACPIAKQACVAKFDTNEDGEVSYAEVYDVTSITDLFANHTGVTSFEELKYFVNVIRTGECFKGCNKIKSLTIPDNIKLIDDECFRYCSSLQTVNIPSSVYHIGSFVFDGCNSLDNKIIIPASMLQIGQCTFNNSGVDTVIMMVNTPPMVYDQTFSNNTIIYIPTSAAEQYKSDVNWSKYKDNFRYIYSGANCFLVPYHGYNMFYCTKKGNSDESVGEVASVEVLWESFGTSTTPNVGDVVYDVKYENGLVGFFTKNDGNAVIAAKDASGNILWSWHIWVCKDFDPEATAQVYNNDAGTLMDRNLGATSAAKGDVHSLGLLYQWGRKDPFLSGGDISSSERAKSTNTWPDAVTTSASVGTVDYAVSHPMTFIGSSGIDWRHSRDWGLWEPTKTKYDPCPPGWRVPDGYGNAPITAVWLKAFNYTRRWTTASNYDSTNKGMDFGTTDIKLGSGTIWYPCCGCLSYTDGQLTNFGKQGVYWSWTPDYNGDWLLQFNETGYVGSLDLGKGALGCSVRCQKE